MSGKDFVELMTTEMIEDPAVSLEGLCDVLVDLNPQAQMTPQALHQRLNPYAVTYLQEVFQWALRQQLEPVCERGYPLKPGHPAPSITCREGLTTLPGHGQLVDL